MESRTATPAGRASTSTLQKCSSTLRCSPRSGQTLTRAETLWLATAANKWFIEEDALGSIEVGNHADLAVLDRDYFTVPDEDIKHIRAILTVVGGKIVHDARVL